MRGDGYALEDAFVEYEASLNDWHINPKIPIRKSVKENFPALYAGMVKRAKGDNKTILSVLYKYLERKGVIAIMEGSKSFRGYTVSDEYSQYLSLSSVSIFVYKKTAKEFWEKLGFIEPKED